MADVYTGTVESVKGFVWQKYVKRQYRKTAGHKKYSFDTFTLKESVSHEREGLIDIFSPWHFLTAFEVIKATRSRISLKSPH